MKAKTSAQLDREITAELGKTKPRKPRKPKAGLGRETQRQKLEREVDDQAARARASHRHALPDASEQAGLLSAARKNLARCIAMDLGHIPLSQGISYECSECGVSGTFDVEPVGSIFTTACTSPKAAAQITYRAGM